MHSDSYSVGVEILQVHGEIWVLDFVVYHSNLRSLRKDKAILKFGRLGTGGGRGGRGSEVKCSVILEIHFIDYRGVHLLIFLYQGEYFVWKYMKD